MPRKVITVVIPQADWLVIWERITPNKDPRTPDIEGIVLDASTHWVQILSDTGPAKQEENRLLKFPLSDSAKDQLRAAFDWR